jgi:hypothetical protein
MKWSKNRGKLRRWSGLCLQLPSLRVSPGVCGYRYVISGLRVSSLFLQVTRHATRSIFFYLISFEVRVICWRFIELLKFYSVIRQQFTLKTWCGIKCNTVLCCANFSQSPSVTYMSIVFFRSLAIPGPTEETAWAWNLFNQNCVKNLILTWHVRIFLIF